MHREGLSGKVTFEQSPEESEGIDHKNVLERGNSLCEGPEAGSRAVSME